MRRLWVLVCLAMLFAGSVRAQPERLQPDPIETRPAAAPNGSAAGSDALEHIWRAAWRQIEGQRLILGGAYEQATLKFRNFRGDETGEPQLTDNGRFVALVQYETEEQYFARVPLQVGQAAFGYNFISSYSSIRADRQLVSSAFEGEEVGTEVKGDYLVVAPSVFVRLGPLYPERVVFWKFAVGVGGGLVRFEGNALAHASAPTAPAQSVTTDGVAPGLFIAFGWELQIENWLLVFRSNFLQGTAQDDPFTYELYSLGLAYGIGF